MTRGEFAEAVYAYCTITGASVTSWIRTIDYNAAKHGVPHSPHIVGLGVDVRYDDDMPAKGRDEWASRLGLKRLFENDHDHLQPLDWRAG